MTNQYKKRSYVLLMLVSLAFIFIMTILFLYGVLGDFFLLRLLLWGLLALMFILSFIFGLGIFLLVYKIKRGSRFGAIGPLIRGSIRILYPIVLLVADIFKYDKDKVKGSFIEINNQLLINNHSTYNPEEILLLLPHCIQNNTCNVKITNDIDNCIKCGKCQMKDILNLRDKYQINILVATGGTIARNIIKKLRPKIVIAVACERDLTSGIFDTEPLPVIGVLNVRPHGPCFNTGVQLDELEKRIKMVIKEEL